MSRIGAIRTLVSAQVPPLRSSGRACFHPRPSVAREAAALLVGDASGDRFGGAAGLVLFAGGRVPLWRVGCPASGQPRG